MKSDTSAWKDFAFSDIFRMCNTKSIKSTSITPDSGSTPYVTASENNNGVQTLIDAPEEWIDEGNCILIGGKTLTVTYQAEDFCSNDSHNIALHLRNQKAVSLEVYLFLVAVLRAKLPDLFKWSDSISMKRARELSLSLPATSGGEPDWDYMKRVMSEQLAQQESKLAGLTVLNSRQRKQIDTSVWRQFRIDELFTLVKGTRLRSTDRFPGDIPYVGASQFNNGITHHIANNEAIHPGGVLTVCYNGPVGTTFYQPEPFWATDDVNVLYPKAAVPIETLLFIAPLIKEVGSKYAYVNKWKMADMAATDICLPVTPTGDPDWGYMQQLMQEKLAQQEFKLDALMSINATVSIGEH